jgi:hypothetical protein
MMRTIAMRLTPNGNAVGCRLQAKTCPVANLIPRLVVTIVVWSGILSSALWQTGKWPVQENRRLWSS